MSLHSEAFPLTVPAGAVLTGSQCPVLRWARALCSPCEAIITLPAGLVSAQFCSTAGPGQEQEAEKGPGLRVWPEESGRVWLCSRPSPLSCSAGSEEPAHPGARDLCG